MLGNRHLTEVLVNRKIVVWVSLTAALLCSSIGPAIAQATYGLAVDNTKDSNPGVTASDFYTLVDDALIDKGKPKFSSLILVFGSCWSSPFSEGLPKSGVGQSGLPVVSLAATDVKDPKQMCSGSQKGNLFLYETKDQWLNSNTGKYDVPVGTVFENANNALQNEIKDTDNNKDTAGVALKPQKPTLTALPEKTQAGKNLTLGGDPKHKKYAILFYGEPDSAFDWRDYAEMYIKLIEAGYEVQGFWGTGQQTASGVPKLPNGDSVEHDAENKSTTAILKFHPLEHPDQEKAMQAKAASFENLQAALRFWRAVSKDNPTAEFFFFSGGHATDGATPRKNLISLLDMNNVPSPRTELPGQAPGPSQTEYVGLPANPTPNLELTRPMEPLLPAGEKPLDGKSEVNTVSSPEPITPDTDKAAKVDSLAPVNNRETLLENAKTEVRSNRETLLENAKTEVRSNRDTLLENAKTEIPANRDTVLENAKTDLQHKPETLHEAHPASTTSRGHEVQQEMRPASRRETREPSREEFARRSETPALNKPAMPSSPFAAPHSSGFGGGGAMHENIKH